MPPSQLKRLKASLREHGITGPQKSKKQKKEAAKSGQRIQRDAALHSIRESFNPFEVKSATRPSKMDVTTAKTMKSSGKGGVQVLGRPAVTKSMGEQTRRNTLLSEVQRRNKVGGILDRRIGENDPTLAPEERALQRFTREKENEGKRGAGVFDLEVDDGDEEEQLTHMGRTLALDKDDFDEGSLGASSDDEDASPVKRKRDELEEEELGEAIEDAPERKKTKAEVMKEVIAKSKLYKYERQAAKEEDEVAREELDKGIGDLRQALFAFQSSLTAPKPTPVSQPQETNNGTTMNPDRAALMHATLDPDKDYDLQIRRMATDKRSKPTDPSHTEKEKSKRDAERLQELEATRLRRMNGQEEDEEAVEPDKEHLTGDVELLKQDEEIDDAAKFGLNNTFILDRPVGFEDEDEFVIDGDLVASASESGEEGSEDESVEPSDIDEERQNEDNEFLYGASTEKERFASASNSRISCPKSYDEILELLGDVKPDEVHSTIRQVRQRYDAGLSASNKQKLADFSEALVVYIGRRPSSPKPPPLSVFEMIIRHVHSLSRTYPYAIGKSFRVHLEAMHKDQSMTPGDLMILTAIGTIYPTSDHFHQVVTPAITLMARWLGLTTPKDTENLATGAYLGALSLKYQALSKRYVPELVRFTLAALRSKQPLTVLEPHITNLQTMANLWFSKSAFIEIFSPAALTALRQLAETKSSHQLQIFLDQAQLARKPLELHHHRPLPIKTAIPKFEEGFNPDKHYDPDRERAESAKLQKEYKKEKKGALRELRKDSNFLAREKLKEKREKDRVYEEKYRRLVAEIQGEEGQERNAYEREKRLRKSRK